MTYDEKLVLARLDALEGRLARMSAPSVPSSSVAQPVSGAEIDAALAAIRDALGPDYLPSRGQVQRWLSRGRTPSQIAEACLSYVAPYRSLAELQVGPDGDWRSTAAYLASVKSHDMWESVYSLTGEVAENSPYVPPADERPHLFADVAIKPTADRVSALVPEVIARAEEGYSYAGNHVTAATLAKAKAALNGDGWLHPEWDGWSDPRLLRVLVLTGVLETERPGLTSYQGYPNWRGLSLEDWLLSQWVAYRSGSGLR